MTCRNGDGSGLWPPMSEPNPDFADRTLEFWQPRTNRTLTAEDAREMTANVAGVFGLLAAWDRDGPQVHTGPGEEPKR